MNAAFFKEKQVGTQNASKDYFAAVNQYLICSTAVIIECILEGWQVPKPSRKGNGELRWPRIDAAIAGELWQEKMNNWDEMIDADRNELLRQAQKMYTREVLVAAHRRNERVPKIAPVEHRAAKLRSLNIFGDEPTDAQSSGTSGFYCRHVRDCTQLTPLQSTLTAHKMMVRDYWR